MISARGRATAGAITAFCTLLSPQIGQERSPDSACCSKFSPLWNQPSNSWPWAQTSPNRIIVGEVRGVEALDLLDAWATGHPGGVATVHASSADGALLRLDRLAQRANVPAQTQLVDALVRRGLEVGEKGALRVPAREQAASLAHGGARLSWKAAQQRVVGVSATERASALSDALTRGSLYLVVRTKVDTVVNGREDVLTQDEVERLAKAPIGGFPKGADCKDGGVSAADGGAKADAGMSEPEDVPIVPDGTEPEADQDKSGGREAPSAGGPREAPSASDSGCTTAPVSTHPVAPIGLAVGVAFALSALRARRRR